MKASCAALVLGLALCASPAAAQYPERTIEFVIPFDAGGSADIEGRLLAEEMSAVLGVTVAPVNRPGAGGALAYSYVNDAEPDGYTVMWTSTSILTITNLGNVPFGFDALDHIGRVEHQPLVLAVGADSPWSDIESLARDCAGRDQTRPNRQLGHRQHHTPGRAGGHAGDRLRGCAPAYRYAQTQCDGAER